jgi:hypothetical protein
MTSKFNPWRGGAFADCVATLEKAGIKRPAAFDIVQEILDTIGRIEREDARIEAAKNASEHFANNITDFIKEGLFP